MTKLVVQGHFHPLNKILKSIHFYLYFCPCHSHALVKKLCHTDCFRPCGFGFGGGGWVNFISWIFRVFFAFGWAYRSAIPLAPLALWWMHTHSVYICLQLSWLDEMKTERQQPVNIKKTFYLLIQKLYCMWPLCCTAALTAFCTALAIVNNGLFVSVKNRWSLLDRFF